MKKVRQTKQARIDELTEKNNSQAARMAEMRTELFEAGKKHELESKKLKQDVDKAYEIERYARFDISKALGKLDDMNRCSPELNWPQIYVELGKLLQIKEDVQMKSYREKMTAVAS
jgi:hypothetical protein